MPLPAHFPLVSQRLTIRPIVEGDLADLLSINGDPEVTRFLPYPTWQSLDDGQAWLKRMQALAEGGTGQQFVLVMNATSRIVGTLLLFRFEESSARAELGYVLGRVHWGRGLMREAITAFCTYAFSHLALRRLEAEVNPANAASAQVLLDVGFTLEGTLRKRWVAKDGAYDTKFFGLLAQEWPAHEQQHAEGSAERVTMRRGQEVLVDSGAPGTASVIDPDTLRARPVDSSAMAAYAAERERTALDTTDAAEAAAIASNTAMLFALLGELERAQRLVEFALQRQAPDVDARARAITEIRAGQVLQMQGRLSEARVQLQAVVERCRSDAALTTLLDFALQHLGKVHFDAASYAEALACFREALVLRERKGAADLVASTRLALDAVYRRT